MLVATDKSLNADLSVIYYLLKLLIFFRRYYVIVYVYFVILHKLFKNDYFITQTCKYVVRQIERITKTI